MNWGYSCDSAMSVKRVNALYSCSIKCYREICSNKKKYYTYKESAKIKQSKTMKDKIKNGTFTVNTNCWYDNKYHVDGYEFRSSREVYFYIYHKMNGNLLKYEHNIIQYYDTTLKSLRNYINDFVDPVSKKYTK